MPIAHAPGLEPLLPVLGEHRTRGTVLDAAGVVTAEISGIDVYALLPGGRWITHDVDVTMGEQPVQAHELIGGEHPDGGWQMHAFDQGPGPSAMRLTLKETGLLLLRGDGVRSWLRPRAGEDHMTALWERDVEGTWLRWMDLRFDRR